MQNILFLILISLCSFSAWSMDFGIDRLSEPSVRVQLINKRLAVLTHAAAKNKHGEHLIDLLHAQYGIKKIFAPEHGLRKLEDTWINDGVDEETGLPVISLYKRHTKAPDPKDLMDVDAIVIDLQDVGVRYYTYFSTIAEVMKVAATMQVEVILLDRPNLLGGKIMEGKVLDPEFTGRFTAYHTVPTRHGMTLGELSMMVNAENKMNTQLTVIPVRGWQRENLLQQLDRPWLAPSPALIELPQVGLYAMWGALESFNVAVGRGLTNEMAFKVLGAPWITEKESQQLALELNRLGFVGLRFYPHSWKVTRAVHVGQVARGVRLVWSGAEVRTDEFAYKVSALLIDKFRGRINAQGVSPLGYGSRAMLDAIRNNVPWSEYAPIIDRDIIEFSARRVPYLLY
jgi:uncharacterized protein YbbC (DUF1343 family)